MAAPDDSVLDEVLPADEVTEALLALLEWMEIHLLTFSVLIQVGLIVGALVPAIIFGPRLKQLILRQASSRLKPGIGRRLVDALADLATPIALYLTLTLIRIGLGSAGPRARAPRGRSPPPGRSCSQAEGGLPSRPPASPRRDRCSLPISIPENTDSFLSGEQDGIQSGQSPERDPRAGRQGGQQQSDVRPN